MQVFEPATGARLNTVGIANAAEQRRFEEVPSLELPLFTGYLSLFPNRRATGF